MALIFLMSGSLLGQRELASAEAVLNQGLELQSNRLYQEAGRKFSSFMERFPGHPRVAEALFHLSEVTFASGNVEEANDLFSEFERRFPKHPLAARARLALGQRLLDGDSFDEASKILLHVVETTRDSDRAAMALYMLGDAAEKRGLYDDAATYYKRASDEYWDSEVAPQAQYSLGVMFASIPNPVEAAEAFEVLVSRFPRSDYARELGLAMAEAYYEVGDYNRTIGEIDKRLPRLAEPLKDRALFLLAEANNQLGNREEAIVYYRRFTEGNQSSPYYLNALYGLGWNYHLEGAHQWAAETFAKVRSAPTNDLSIDATYYEAVNLRLAGRLADAASLFETVVANNESHRLADQSAFEYGMALYELRKWDEAEAAFRSFTERFKSSPRLGEGLRMLGECQVALGDYDEAMTAFDSAIALDSAPAALRGQVEFQKAWLMYRRDNFVEAASAFEAIQRTDEDADLAPDALFWAAESQFQSGNYSQSVALLKSYQSRYRRVQHSQEQASYYVLGWSHFKQAQFSSSILAFEKFLYGYQNQGDPRYLLDARLRLGDSYFALKRYEESISAYSRVRGEQEDYALYQVGRAHYNKGSMSEANEALADLIARFPYSEWREEAIFTSGSIHFEKEEYSLAETVFSDLVDRFPDHPLAAKSQYSIGDALFNSGRLRESVSAYGKVLDNYPSSEIVIDAFGGMQYALVVLDSTDAIDGIVDSFSRKHPNSPFLEDLQFRQAEIRFESGDFEAAVAAVDRFIARDPSSRLLPKAYLYRGQANYELGNLGGAERDFRTLVDRFGASADRPEAERRLGSILIEDGRYEEALAVFTDLDREGVSPEIIAEARYQRGMSLLGLQRTEEARTLLEAALPDDTSNLHALPTMLGLARVYEMEGRLSEAMRNYRTVIADSEDELGAEATWRLGALLNAEGQPYEALEELGRLPVLFPAADVWVARGYLQQAQSYVMLDQRGNAIQMYDVVMSQYAGTEEARLAEENKRRLE